MEVRGPAETIERFLREQPEVALVQAQALEATLTAFEIRAKDRKDLRELLAGRLAARGWALRRLDLKRANLEDQYTAVVRQSEEPPATPDAPVPSDTVPVA